jgi:hypothetical protein
LTTVKTTEEKKEKKIHFVLRGVYQQFSSSHSRKNANEKLNFIVRELEPFGF